MSLRLPVVPNRRLQTERQNLGLSIPALALLAGVPSVQTVYDAENGVRRPTMTTRDRIVSALNKRRLERDPKASRLQITDLWPAPLEQIR